MDIAKYDKQSLRQFRLSTALLSIGLILLGISFYFSYMFSNDIVTDGPNHDYVLWYILLPGSILLIIGAASLFSIEWKSNRVGLGKITRFRIAFSILIISALTTGYFLNPLLSPIPFFHDSDMDSIPDYSDAFPYNASRQDYPYAWPGTMMLSTWSGGWVVTAYMGFISCWTDATYVKATRWDNSTVLNYTLLNSMGGGVFINGVKFNNLDENDTLDDGDSFELKHSTFTDGFRFGLYRYHDGEYQQFAGASKH